MCPLVVTQGWRPPQKRLHYDDEDGWNLRVNETDPWALFCYCPFRLVGSVAFVHLPVKSAIIKLDPGQCVAWLFTYAFPHGRDFTETILRCKLSFRNLEDKQQTWRLKNSPSGLLLYGLFGYWMVLIFIIPFLYLRTQKIHQGCQVVEAAPFPAMWIVEGSSPDHITIPLHLPQAQ